MALIRLLVFLFSISIAAAQITKEFDSDYELAPTDETFSATLSVASGSTLVACIPWRDSVALNSIADDQGNTSDRDWETNSLVI